MQDRSSTRQLPRASRPADDVQREPSTFVMHSQVMETRLCLSLLVASFYREAITWQIPLEEATTKAEELCATNDCLGVRIDY